ncbi:hypothetical protein V8F33_011675 [Rhypophila sp. PSN 637]
MLRLTSYSFLIVRRTEFMRATVLFHPSRWFGKYPAQIQNNDDDAVTLVAHRVSALEYTTPVLEDDDLECGNINLESLWEKQSLAVFSQVDMSRNKTKSTPAPQNQIVVLLSMQHRVSTHDESYMREPDMSPSKSPMLRGRALLTLMVVLVLLFSILLVQRGSNKGQTLRQQGNFALWTSTANRNQDYDILPVDACPSPKAQQNKEQK